MTNSHSPRFSGMFIPARLLNAAGMNILDKTLLAQIEALSRRQQGCTATNAYLAETFGVNESTISRAVGRLETLGLLDVSYAENNYRTIRLTRLACGFWMPDLEAGDEPLDPSRRNAYTSRRNAQQKIEEEVEEESYPAASTQAESLCAEESACLAERQTSTPHARAQGEDSQNSQANDDIRLRAEMVSMGFANSQADTALRTARKNGRANAWVREWLDRASREGRKPDCYAFRMIEANRDIPSVGHPTPRSDSDGDPYSRTVPPERAAAIDAHADAEYQRTRRQVREISDGRPMTPEERELLHATMGQLKAKMTLDAPLVKARPKPISEEEQETLKQVRAELQCRRVGK